MKQDTVKQDTQREPDWRDRIPHAFVAFAVLFNLVSLRAERFVVSAANDGPQHQLMISWARDRIADGHMPFDGWYAYLGFGSPHFRHYQSLPHIIGGLFATIFGPPNVYQWSLYLLLALWPICVYISGRLFGADRWVSGIAALVSLLVVSDPVNHIGFEFGSYTRGGYGVWAQLWGMWLLPLALALAWRAVQRGGSYLAAAAALAALLAGHFLTGYLGVLVIGAWLLVSTRGFVRRVLRTAVVGVGALLVGVWAVGPPLLDAKWASRQEWLLNSFYTDSYGPKQVLSWLVRGEIFDAGRRPILTIFAAVGVAACIAHWKDLRARALVILTGLSLALYMGRDVVGIVLDRLPIGGDILLHRYVMGVHLGGIFLVGVGATWIGGLVAKGLVRLIGDPKMLPRRIVRQRMDIAVAALLVFGFVLLQPAWSERASFNAASAAAIAGQRISDATDGKDLGALIDLAKKRGDGRIYAGMSAGSGDSYLVGGAQVYRQIADHTADGVGYIERTLSIPQNVERLFVETNPLHYELFNVRYVLSDREPAIPKKYREKIERRGRHTLWEIETSGYLDVIDTSGSVTTTRATLGRDMGPFLASDAPETKIYPTVSWDGVPAPAPTVTTTRPNDAPGRVEKQFARIADGEFGGEIDVKRRSVVLLKSSFDPRWDITVDGERKEPEMIAPGFVGAVVEPGEHTVRFEYRPLQLYWLLFLISALAAVGLALLPRFVPVLRGPAADGSGTEGVGGGGGI